MHRNRASQHSRNAAIATNNTQNCKCLVRWSTYCLFLISLLPVADGAAWTWQANCHFHFLLKFVKDKSIWVRNTWFCSNISKQKTNKINRTLLFIQHNYTDELKSTKQTNFMFFFKKKSIVGNFCSKKTEKSSFVWKIKEFSIQYSAPLNTKLHNRWSRNQNLNEVVLRSFIVPVTSVDVTQSHCHTDILPHSLLYTLTHAK